MKHPLIATLLICSLVATAQAKPLPTLVTTAAQTIGSLKVKQYGHGKTALILIPGLGCGDWVWADLVRDLQNDYRLYTVTLPGFDGTPTITTPYLGQVLTSLKLLIRQEKLRHPVIIGHSLGGYVALRLAEEAPNLPGSLIIIDALPIFPPAVPGETPAQRQAMAQNFTTSRQPQSL